MSTVRKGLNVIADLLLILAIVGTLGKGNHDQLQRVLAIVVLVFLIRLVGNRLLGSET